MTLSLSTSDISQIPQVDLKMSHTEISFFDYKIVDQLLCPTLFQQSYLKLICALKALVCHALTDVGFSWIAI